MDGVERYFVFLVLPFGLSSAPLVFTKVMRCLVKFWRSHSVKIACYLDDGAGYARDKLYAAEKSCFVKGSLEGSGFVINKKKSK